MRKVILYIATTLDGYIADEHDGFSFLHEYDSVVEVQQSYEQLMKRIDTIIMGRTTYDVIKALGEWPYATTQSYIVSRSVHPQEQCNVTWITDPVALINQLRTQSGRDIWLVGGAQLMKTFLENDLIDEYQIAIIPKLIGTGKPLFLPHGLQDKLKLNHVERMDDLVLLTYTTIQ